MPQHKARLSRQEPRYTFFLNPYEDIRFTSCPQCGRKMRQRKLPLVIHVDPMNPIVLNKTCRYCPDCDLLIAHKNEIESFLTQFFMQHKPEVVGNEYLVIGTFDRAVWKEGVKQPGTIETMRDNLHDFIERVTFKVQGGWMPKTTDKMEG